MKKFLAAFLSSLVMLASGICLLINPMGFISYVCYILGAVLIAAAVLKFLGAYKKNRISSEVASCLILFVLGIVLIVLQANLLGIIPLVVGICFLVYGLLKLKTAFSFRKVSDIAFKKLVFPAIIEIVLAVLIIVLSGQAIEIVLRFIGILLIYNAAEGIYSTVIKNGPMEMSDEKSKKDIEADYEEKDDD